MPPIEVRPFARADRTDDPRDALPSRLVLGGLRRLLHDVLAADREGLAFSRALRRHELTRVERGWRHPGIA